jgi:hypothetical protein
MAACRFVSTFRASNSVVFDGWCGLQYFCFSLRTGRLGAVVGRGFELASRNGWSEADPSNHQDKRAKQI